MFRAVPASVEPFLGADEVGRCSYADAQFGHWYEGVSALALPAPRAHRIVVEQAKGYLRESLGVSILEAFALLRSYARTHGDHLTEVCRRLMSDPDASQALLDALGSTAASA